MGGSLTEHNDNVGLFNYDEKEKRFYSTTVQRLTRTTTHFDKLLKHTAVSMASESPPGEKNT